MWCFREYPLCMLHVPSCWILVTFSFSSVVFRAFLFLLWADFFPIWVEHVLRRCALACLQNKTCCCHCHQNWVFTKLMVWETSCWWGLCGSSGGKELAALGLRQEWLGRADLLKHGGMELAISKLGRDCWHWACSLRWLWVYTEVQRKKMSFASYFVPGRVVPWSLPFWATLRWVNNYISCLPLAFFKLCLKALAPLAVFLCSLFRVGIQLPDALQAHSELTPMTFKVLDFKSCFRIHEIWLLSPSWFQD